MTFCVFQNETIDSDQTDDGEGVPTATFKILTRKTKEYKPKI